MITQVVSIELNIIRMPQEYIAGKQWMS